jgi:hypothetical protein
MDSYKADGATLSASAHLKLDNTTGFGQGNISLDSDRASRLKEDGTGLSGWGLGGTTKART